MNFSIVIPARIMTDTLANTLNKVLELNYNNYEVIVILDYEDHLSRGKFPDVKFIICGIKTPGEKRNIGINESQGEFIAFLDDDAYPDKDWLINASQIFSTSPELIAVCGPSITPKESHFLQIVSGFILESFLTSGPTTYRHYPKKERFVDDYPSVNLIVKKFCLEQIGGFDEKYWPGEDTKLCRDLILKFKQKIYYSPKIVVHHFRRNIFHPHLIQISRYAAHRGMFVKLFPENSFKFTYFMPSLFSFYLIFTFLMFFLDFEFFKIMAILLLAYFSLLIFEGIKIYKKSTSFGISLLSMFGIFATNLVYGLYFIFGLISKPKLSLREIDVKNGKYLKG